MKHSKDIQKLKESLEMLPIRHHTHHVNGQLNIIDLVIPLLEDYEEQLDLKDKRIQELKDKLYQANLR